MNKYPDDWKLLEAQASAILPSRWNILWNYIIRRKVWNYVLTAWVHSMPSKEKPFGEIGEMSLRIDWHSQGKAVKKCTAWDWITKHRYHSENIGTLVEGEEKK